MGRRFGHSLSRALSTATATVLAALALSGVTPQARACACGAVVTQNETPVTHETAFVWYDGNRESIDMVLGLNGPVENAAWIMPVAPDTDVSLGRSASIDTAQADAAPTYRTVHKYQLGSIFSAGSASSSGAQGRGAAAQQPPVNVDKVSTVGPFQVTQLSGTSGGAVDAWLTRHGYPSKPALSRTFSDYLAKGWKIDAVKLLPSREGTYLPSTWPALRLSFPTQHLVYPLALSHHATVAQSVTLYIAAPHKMAVSQQPGDTTHLRLQFAGRVPSSHAGSSQSLAGQLDGAPAYYLTTYTADYPVGDIARDATLTQAPDDAPYREVITDYDTVTIPIEGVLVLAAIPVLIVVSRRARRRADRRSS